METIMSTIVEIPMSHIAVVLMISTIALLFGRIKLALFINYCFIVYSGHLWDVSLFSDVSDTKLNSSAFVFMGFWIMTVLLAAVSLTFHKE
jgi:hypothetical protein